MSSTPIAGTRERILEAAANLFYRQGYQATVVNQIIEEAGVSKPTFYAHFPSKEELCVAYLRDNRKRDLEYFREEIRRQTEPLERFLSPIRVLRARMLDTGFRGCGYFNMLVEVIDRDNPIVREVEYFTESFREMLRDLASELKQSHPKYAALDVNETADAYYLLFGGAIMVGQEYDAIWPVDLAIRQVARLTDG